jgi:hypothetical protein
MEGSGRGLVYVTIPTCLRRERGEKVISRKEWVLLTQSRRFVTLQHNPENHNMNIHSHGPANLISLKWIIQGRRDINSLPSISIPEGRDNMGAARNVGLCSDLTWHYEGNQCPLRPPVDTLLALELNKV